MSVRIRKIVVTTDFSETSRSAFPLAREMAERFEAELHCLYALRQPDPFWIGNPVMGPVLPTEDELEGEARERLMALIDGHLSGLAKPATPAVVHGPCCHAILDFAEQNDIDLIVMATHGHTGLQHVLIGSTTERVVRGATCPVVTVRCRNT